MAELMSEEENELNFSDYEANSDSDDDNAPRPPTTSVIAHKEMKTVQISDAEEDSDKEESDQEDSDKEEANQELEFESISPPAEHSDEENDKNNDNETKVTSTVLSCHESENQTFEPISPVSDHGNFETISPPASPPPQGSAETRPQFENISEDEDEEEIKKPEELPEGKFSPVQESDHELNFIDESSNDSGYHIIPKTPVEESKKTEENNEEGELPDDVEIDDIEAPMPSPFSDIGDCDLDMTESDGQIISDILKDTDATEQQFEFKNEMFSEKKIPSAENLEGEESKGGSQEEGEIDIPKEKEGSSKGEDDDHDASKSDRGDEEKDKEHEVDDDVEENENDEEQVAEKVDIGDKGDKEDKEELVAGVLNEEGDGPDEDVAVEDVAEKDVAEEDVAEEDVAEEDVAEEDVVEKDVAKKDVAKKDVAEEDVAEKDVAEKDVAEDDVAEDDVAEDDVAEDDAAEDDAAVEDDTEKDVAEEDVAQKDVAETEIAEKDVADNDNVVEEKNDEIGESKDEDGVEKGEEPEKEKEDKKDDEEEDGEDAGDLIADIFGESDEEEEFEGFADEEMPEGDDKEASDDDDEVQPVKDVPSETRQKTSEKRDESSDDEPRMPARDFVNDFDLMLEKKKAEKRSKRTRKDVDIISDNDEIISNMIKQMKDAAEEDRMLNQAGKAATKKLKMLSHVIKSLRKSDLQMTFIDCGVLSGIKEWLTPLPDHALPHIHIRKLLLQLLTEFPPLEKSSLKSSGIGRAVMLLFKHPKETRENKYVAGKIISNWARPIFNVSTNFMDMSKEEREERDKRTLMNSKKREPTTEEIEPKRTKLEEEDNENKPRRPGDPGWCTRARVPQASNRDYVNRPISKIDAYEQTRSLNTKKPMNRYEKHALKMKNKRPGKAKAMDISLSGSKMGL